LKRITPWLSLNMLRIEALNWAMKIVWPGMVASVIT
jgi:hypothetical protein